MAKKQRETSVEQAEVDPPEELQSYVLEPGARLKVRVLRGEDLVDWVIEAQEDGSLMRIYVAPEPAIPVQTPNPISGT